MALEVTQALKLIEKAVENIYTERLYQMYLTILPTMTAESFMSFEAFLDASVASVSLKTAETILEETQTLYDANKWEVMR